jgi:hypothetical protein
MQAARQLRAASQPNVRSTKGEK